MSSFSAIFKLKAVDDGMSSTIDAAKAKVGGIGGALGGAFKNSVGKVFSATAAMTMLKGTMEEVLNRAKQYNNLGQRMGIPAVEVQKLDKAAEAAGINVASLGRSMLLVQKFGAEGLAGTTEKAKLLTGTLGASREELERMKAGGTEGLATLADKMANIADEGERDAVGLKILGEKWFEVKQFVEQGGDAVRKAGGDQVTWGKETQDSLTRMQKAWANMWNELSVATADFMRDLEPILGLLRVVINILMPAVRLALAAIGYVLDGIQLAIMGVAYWWFKVFGSDEDLARLEKGMERINKKIDERNAKLKENIDKDYAGLEKGALMVIGGKTGDEAKGEKEKKKSTDTRTMEEREAYEKALKKQKEINIEKGLENAQEEEKVRLMIEQLYLLKEQEKVLKEKHPERYKETAEYLELQNKIADQQRKIRKEARDQEMAASKREFETQQGAAKRRLELMKANGATEQEIFQEEFNMKKEQIIRIGEELQALQRDEFATNEDRRKKIAELAEATADADTMLLKREKDMTKAGGGPKVSAIQAIGGGGNIGVGGINYQKATLDEVKLLRKTAEEQLRVMSGKLNINLGEVTYGTNRRI